MRGRHSSLLLAAWLAWMVAAAGVTALPARRLQQQQQILTGPAPGLEAYRRAGCDNFTLDQWQPLRPGFHITVPYGWMNDPHGMFQHRGRTHIFFQYNPKAIAWGAPFWGHVVSDDLAHWTWLPPALLPDSAYDFNGVWSGAATVGDGDTPILTYTAASTSAPELGNFFQRQAMAEPADLSDPLLKAWVKAPTNPFIVQVPPGGTNFQFRDPTEARHAVWLALTDAANPSPLPKSAYALAIGVQAYCLGGAGIYAAPSMAGPWSYMGSLFNQLDIQPEINGQCMAGRAAGGSGWPGPAYGGPCDQFGAACRMWEVVDFAALDAGMWLLKWDDQSRFRGLFSMEWYVLGNAPWNYAALNPRLARQPAPAGTRAAAKPPLHAGMSGYPNASSPQTVDSQAQDADFNRVDTWADSATQSLFRAEVDGQRFAPQRMDYGSIYATMMFRTNDSRQLMFSWIQETAAGCRDSCSDQLPDVIASMGFKGAQTLPRQLSYDAATKSLRAYPAAEVQALRGKQLVNASDLLLATLPAATPLVPVGRVGRLPPLVPVNSSGSNSTGSSGGSSRRAAVTARQFEAQLNFTLLPPGSPASAAGANASGAPLGASSSRPFVSGPDEFAAGLRLLTGGDTWVDVYLRGRVAPLAPASPAFALTELSVWVDRRAAGGASNTSFAEGGPVPLPLPPAPRLLLPNAALSLSVWVDHSVLEVFAAGGLARVTSRIYPAGDDVAWGLQAWAVPPINLAPGVPGRPDLGRRGDPGAPAAGSVARKGLRPPSIVTGVYCWWCRAWARGAGGCEDVRCFSPSRFAPQLGAWAASLSAAVWEVGNAWLGPDC